MYTPDPKENEAYEYEEYEGLNVKDMARELEQLHKNPINDGEKDVEDPPMKKTTAETPTVAATNPDDQLPQLYDHETEVQDFPVDNETTETPTVNRMAVNQNDVDVGTEEESETTMNKSFENNWWKKKGLDVWDPHPLIKLIATKPNKLWNITGSKRNIDVRVHHDECSQCGKMTRSNWCSHLVSAGLREGIIFQGKARKLSRTKLTMHQRNTKIRSGLETAKAI